MFLEDLAARKPIGKFDTRRFGDPLFIDSIEWFATSNDIYRAFIGLNELAVDAGISEMKKVLELQPRRFPFNRTDWSYVGFKGGSEPGVLMLAYVAERTDGRQFVQVMSLADEDHAFNSITSVLLAIEGFRLLADVE